MAQEFLGKGWKAPVNVDSRSGIAMSEYEEDINEAIWIILRTAKGERVMRPDFGCGIHDYNFDIVNTTNIALIENSIKEALTLWEPRVDVMNVTTSDEEINKGKLFIDIEYRVKSTNNRFNLVYPFYISEGE